MAFGPIDVQRRLGLFNPLGVEGVLEQIAMLKERNLGIIALSAHDSSDEVIELVRNEVGEAHRYVRDGEEIVISAQ